jgi:hypothetical protein
MTQVQVIVHGYPDSDPAELAGLAGELRGELLDRDVDDVSHPQATTPERAKGGTAFEWAQLVVTLGGSVPGLVAAVRGWRQRRPGTSIELSIDGDSIRIDDASDGERRQLLDQWLQRHDDG